LAPLFLRAYSCFDWLKVVAAAAMPLAGDETIGHRQPEGRGQSK
jgi:hypothetical protein